MKNNLRKSLAALALVGLASLAACSMSDTTTADAPSASSAPATSAPASTTPASDAMTAPFGPACSAVPTEGKGSFDGMSKDPVATAASNNPELSTLVTAVTAAGLGDTLNSADGITVFAPANSAFAAMDQATLKKALDDPKGLLTTVLTYHVVPGKIAPDALAGTHKTLQGGELKVEGSGEDFTVNGSAKVVCGNVQTANATVYIIDNVLLPPADASQGGAAMTAPFGPGCSAVPADGKGSFDGMSKDPVATAASNNPVLSTLVTAVKAAGLVDTLNSADGITVFAPADSAFKAMDQATLKKALDDPKGLLTTVLTYHVVPGKIAPEQLAGTHKTLQGGEVKVEGSGEAFTVNGSAKVICGNVQTANATVYIIDGVLLPPA